MMGEFSEEEKKLLIDVSSELNIDVDIDKLEETFHEYKVIVDEGLLSRTGEREKNIWRKK